LLELYEILFSEDCKLAKWGGLEVKKKKESNPTESKASSPGNKPFQRFERLNLPKSQDLIP